MCSRSCMTAGVKEGLTINAVPAKAMCGLVCSAERLDRMSRNACIFPSSAEASCWKQASGKRELEYRAGEQDTGDEAKEQRKGAEEEKAGRPTPEGEAAQPESAEQPGPEEEEGPVNEQAGEAGQQQSFTTPEVRAVLGSFSICKLLHQMTVLTADVSSSKEMHASYNRGACADLAAACHGELGWR